MQLSPGHISVPVRLYAATMLLAQVHCKASTSIGLLSMHHREIACDANEAIPQLRLTAQICDSQLTTRDMNDTARPASSHTLRRQRGDSRINRLQLSVALPIPYVVNHGH